MFEPNHIERLLLRAIRRSGLSIYRLAREAGISHSIIVRFLHKERSVTLQTAEKIATALGLRLELTQGKGKPKHRRQVKNDG